MKGGVGKTSIIYELAKELSRQGHSVCVMDAYFNMNVCSTMFEDRPGVDLKEYLCGNLKAYDVINETQYYNLYYVKSNSVTFDYLAQSELIKEFTVSVSCHFDFFLIDVNCFNERILNLMLEVSSESMIIVNDQEDTIRNSMKLVQKVHLYSNINNISMTINQARIIKEMKGQVLGEEEIEDILKQEILFIFPKFYKHNIFRSGMSVKKRYYIQKFCRAFLSNTKEILDYKKDYKGIFGMFKRRLYEKFE